VARIPPERRGDPHLTFTFAIVDYPAEPTTPGRNLYRFVLADPEKGRSS
jgi:hypothetical protein